MQSAAPATPRRRPRIGLLIAGGTYAYQAQLTHAAHEECRRRHLDLFCLAGGSLAWADPRSHCYELPSAGELDAAILVTATWGAGLEAEPVRALVDRFASIPHCLVGGCAGSSPSVRVDNAGGVIDLVRHLIQIHGCRRIAHVAGPGPEGRERLDGYRRALAEAGLTLDERLIFEGDFQPGTGRAAVDQFVCDGEPCCDAIFAANDWMATGVLVALQERGIRVPEDVALAGFDDIDRAAFLSPPLTTVRQPPARLGVEAVRLVAEQLEGELSQRHVSVGTLPQIRRSCGCFGHATAPGLALESGPVTITSLARARAQLVRAIENVRAPLSDGLAADWRERLVTALCDDLEASTQDRFAEAVAALVEGTAHGGNITAWYHVVLQLRQASVAVFVADASVLVRAETLFGRAYIAIGELAELAQGQRLIEREDMMTRLEDVGNDARTALDWPGVCRVLTVHLPRFGISRCFVAAGSGGAGTECRQIFAYDRGAAIELPKGGISFEASQLISPELYPVERGSFVTYPLVVRDEVLGHCCFELGSRDIGAFKTLGDLIASGIKAAELSEALVVEVTRRERAEKQRMLQELEIAAGIQAAIIPESPQVRGLELATVMLPATEVGGDYFDVLPCSGGCWIGIGDVAGHGLQAGLVMLMIQAIVASTVNGREDIAPKEAWCLLNTVLSHNIRSRMQRDEHATLSLIRYHESGRLRFAGGHEDIIVYRQATGRCDIIPTPGIWAGVMEHVDDDACEEGELWLERGDVALFYTDGVIEARGRDGEHYEVERLVSRLASAASLSVEQIRDAIVADVTEFMTEQDDDLTLMVLRHVGV